MEKLIDELGGNKVLADEFGLTPNAISNWRKRDIPWKMRPAVAQMAAKQGVTLPADFWGVGG
jgi:uncharacterized protein YjcR